MITVIKWQHPGVWLTVLFAVLKVAGAISWPWWVVLSPFWGTLVLSGMIYTIGIGLINVGEWLQKRRNRR